MPSTLYHEWLQQVGYEYNVLHDEHYLSRGEKLTLILKFNQ